jgi:hypothetical protein
MSAFHRTIADNVGSIKKWHDHNHPGNWPDCGHEPCNVTDTEWRKAWSR